MGNQATKQKEGKLTGTAADLRRLRVPALKQKLRELGVPEEAILNGRRWELVDLLRYTFTISFILSWHRCQLLIDLLKCQLVEIATCLCFAANGYKA